jgi:hypothetical protein
MEEFESIKTFIKLPQLKLLNLQLWEPRKFDVEAIQSPKLLCAVGPIWLVSSTERKANRALEFFRHLLNIDSENGHVEIAMLASMLVQRDRRTLKFSGATSDYIVGALQDAEMTNAIVGRFTGLFPSPFQLSFLKFLISVFQSVEESLEQAQWMLALIKKVVTAFDRPLNDTIACLADEDEFLFKIVGGVLGDCIDINEPLSLELLRGTVFEAPPFLHAASELPEFAHIVEYAARMNNFGLLEKIVSVDSFNIRSPSKSNEKEEPAIMRALRTLDSVHDHILEIVNVKRDLASAVTRIFSVAGSAGLNISTSRREWPGAVGDILENHSNIVSRK